MDHEMNSLHPFNDEDITIDELLPVFPAFNVPRLSNKPQDPIIDTLRFRKRKENLEMLPLLSPIGWPAHELLRPKVNDFNAADDVWKSSIRPNEVGLNIAFSWDTFRTSSAAAPISSPLLFQQSGHVADAVRRMYNPSIQDPSTEVVQTTPYELLCSVGSVLSGLSSPLYIWCPRLREFRLRSATEVCGLSQRLEVSCLDYGTSRSLVQRFLIIGSLMRRLEALVTNVWQSSSKKEPAIHAFSHALSSILSHIKSVLSRCYSPAPEPSPAANLHALMALWVECAGAEAQLEAISGLCGQSLDGSAPVDFTSQSASHLLDLIYQRLQSCLNEVHTSDIAAMIAYLLTSTSRHYFDSICRSVGYSGNALTKKHDKSRERHRAPFGTAGEADEIGGNNEEDEDDKFPSFFPTAFSRILVRSRKSLRLLRIAQPGHPLLDESCVSRRQIKWIWTEDEIIAAWEDLGSRPNGSTARTLGNETPSGQVASVANHLNSDYPFEIQEFARFDLEPGENPPASSAATHAEVAPPTFVRFLQTFPHKLPSITPCLSNLTDLVLSPLAAHVEHLSTALVDVFLAPSDGYLSFRHHIILLRSYLLSSSPAFKTRLQSALFSNSPDGEGGHLTRCMRVHTKRNPSAAWVIGLSPALTEDKHWPPAGADLSYLLRTVIIDSLDDDYPCRQLEGNRSTTDTMLEQLIYEEAEWRLGFAIRDLPLGAGHAKWLNPRSIEALDFLYMNYQPPAALEIMFPASTLSKYHRLFTFNLRLLRVENVVNALFRMSTRSTDALFQTLTPSQKQFEHFRFMASAFVASLTSYMYDTAIGGNFDVFMAKLSPLQDNLVITKQPSHFSDVFALAEAHSDLLDTILGACLLRSSQKAVGDLLRGILHVILEFGILMSDLKRGHLQEYEASGPLSELFADFRKKMIKFVRVLRSLVDKGTLSSQITFEDMRLQLLSGHRIQGVGVIANLYDLLVRLDTAEWWAQQRKR